MMPGERTVTGQGVGDGLGDQGLAAAGRAVEQDALGRAQLMLVEDLRVEVGKLDRVAQDLDLIAQTGSFSLLVKRHRGNRVQIRFQCHQAKQGRPHALPMNGHYHPGKRATAFIRI